MITTGAFDLAHRQVSDPEDGPSPPGSPPHRHFSSTTRTLNRPGDESQPIDAIQDRREQRPGHCCPAPCARVSGFCRPNHRPRSSDSASHRLGDSGRIAGRLFTVKWCAHQSVRVVPRGHPAFRRVRASRLRSHPIWHPARANAPARQGCGAGRGAIGPERPWSAGRQEAGQVRC